MSMRDDLIPKDQLTRVDWSIPSPKDIELISLLSQVPSCRRVKAFNHRPSILHMQVTDHQTARRFDNQTCVRQDR